jgi:hypothetical protein
MLEMRAEMHIGYHVKIRCRCPILNKLRMSSRIVLKFPSISFHETHFSSCFMYTQLDSRTDMAKIIDFLHLLRAITPRT